MAEWPSLREIRAFLRLEANPTEDALIDAARASAIEYCVERTDHRWPAEVSPIPAMLHQAALYQAAHDYKRRDSLDGALGFGEMGVVRVPRFDPDVERLLDSLGPFVFG